MFSTSYSQLSTSLSTDIREKCKDLVDKFSGFFCLDWEVSSAYNCRDVFSKEWRDYSNPWEIEIWERRGCLTDEDDVSAEEEAEIKSTWLPQQDEYKGWKKSSPGQKSQGTKSSFRIRRVEESFEVLIRNSLLLWRYDQIREFKKDQRFFDRLSERKIRREPDPGALCSQG